MDTRFAKSAYGYFMLWGIIASLGTTVSTIVDALLVGNIIGSDGLAVANIATPVFLTYALFGLTIGVGANTIIGRALGASDVNEANRVFRAQLTVGLVIGIICLLPLLFKESFFGFLGLTDELYMLGEQYMTVVLCSAPVFVMFHIFAVSVRTDSDPKLAAAASAVVIIVNLSLDILFMQVLGFGIIGASASLCIAETLGLVVLFTHFLKKRSLLKLRISIPKPSDVKTFVVNGFGVGSASIFQAIVMLVFNVMLIRFGGELGTLYVAIFGVMYTVSMIPFAVFDGASSSLSTVSAFFVGEADAKSIFTVLWRAVTAAIVGGGLITALCIIFARELALFFGLDAASLDTAAYAIRIFAASIMFTGVNTVVTAFWQSIGRSKLATAMSVLRNFGLMLIIGLVLIANMSLTGLSLTYVCTEVLCALIIIGFLIFGGSKKYVAEKCGSAERTFESNYVIKTESLEQISGDLEGICDEWEIGPKQAFFVNLVCEELVLNIIKFGLKDNRKKHYIDIKLMEKSDGYVIRIRDNVSLYNPFESNGDEIDNGVLELIKKKTKYCDYQRKMIFNYLYMII